MPPTGKSNNKKYSSAPLPFMGQKRRFVQEFRKALATFNDTTVFVDLFGGSGLLSHIVKQERADARVIYNDYDDYHLRVDNVETTNKILAEVRDIVRDAPRNKKLTPEIKSAVLECVSRYDRLGYVDYITLSSSLLFTVNYVKSFKELARKTLYNNVKQNGYQCDGYLDGLEIVKFDYLELYNMYKDQSNVVFFLDPPYLSTEVLAYENYWNLKDYLDILSLLKDTSYFYFTSSKSALIEFIEWFEASCGNANIFGGATKKEIKVGGFAVSYTDIMLYKLYESNNQ